MNLKTLEQIQIEHFIDTLEYHSGYRDATADSLNWSRKSINNWIDKAKKKGYRSGYFTKHRRGVPIRRDDFAPETMLSKTINHIVDALVHFKGDRAAAAKTLCVCTKTISNYIKMAELESLDCDFIGHRPPRVENKARPSQYEPELIYPMPTNEERLHYLDFPEKRYYKESKNA